MPKGVGSTLSRLVFNFSVEKDLAALKTSHNSSSSKIFIDLRASGLSFVGRISDKMTSAEREHRYSGTRCEFSYQVTYDLSNNLALQWALLLMHREIVDLTSNSFEPRKADWYGVLCASQEDHGSSWKALSGF